ncbi:molybdate transport system regulatory protein [Halopelagius inordinatus]|uniref:Molybdate transport system regulatory protein n=1 Tax=Halopelagius inordinatus TaxID=553467 RepID=A0A1I2TCF5_9EURY|nr:TOBE domain-containing protein [Halopelagius inordinatus]SFG62582.1 molybdate transport system regulatory protein [Halopelagius inordinatus]
MVDDWFEAYLDADGVSFDDDDAALLRAVSETGSVSAAASSLERSRPRCLSRLQELEDALGSLVERRRGGSDSGGSELTPAGRDVLARFDRLHAALSGTAGVPETMAPGTVTGVEGELCDVETEAGRVRAIGDEAVREPGRPVQVSVRADAVTLHAPDDAPAPGATSARNRLDGAVEAVERGDAVVRVAVDVGFSDPLWALVTADSADRLGLAPGAGVVASWKATATRATAVETVTERDGEGA